MALLYFRKPALRFFSASPVRICIPGPFDSNQRRALLAFAHHVCIPRARGEPSRRRCIVRLSVVSQSNRGTAAIMVIRTRHTHSSRQTLRDIAGHQGFRSFFHSCKFYVRDFLVQRMQGGIALFSVILTFSEAAPGPLATASPPHCYSTLEQGGHSADHRRSPFIRSSSVRVFQV